VDVRQVLGTRYRLEERLGEGGMSVVWRGFDLVLGRPVAVKVLSGRYATDDDFRQSIRSEAQAAARVSHPHLASVHDYGESLDSEGRRVPYVVMELLSGPTLIERLASGPMPPRAGLKVCAEIAEALAAAHAHNLVHRDVKPGNVMLTPVGAKLVDFGVAAVAGAPGGPGPDGRIMGTPNYVAPERLVGGPVEPASDVYGLGLLIFRVLTGRLPWPSGAPSLAVRADPLPLPPVDGVPSEVNELYLRCVAMQAEQRPTAAEAAGLLGAAVNAMPPGSDEDDAALTAPVLVGAGARTGHGDETTVANRTPRVAAVALSAAAATVAALLIVSQTGWRGTGAPDASGTTGPTAATTVATPEATTDPASTPPPDGGPPGPGGQTGTVPGGSGGGSGPSTTAPGFGPSKTPPPAPTGTTTFETAGGSVVASCYGMLAHLDDWEPAAGFTVARVEEGPVAQAAIVFRSPSLLVRVFVQCTNNGLPRPRTVTEPVPTRGPSPTPSPAP
jgi:serine/threonine-protein kinase